MLQIFLQQCSQLGTDISTVWQSYGGQYLAGMGATLRLALLATLIGCIIGFFCGILNTICQGYALAHGSSSLCVVSLDTLANRCGGLAGASLCLNLIIALGLERANGERIFILRSLVGIGNNC